MGVYENLKTFIQENIKPNGQGEITGQVLQDVLMSMADSLERNAIIVRGDVDSSGILEGEYEGYSNKAISQTSMAIGAATTAGLKGWYYSAIDFANKKITLSDRPTYILAGTTLINGGWSSGTPNINVDDVISLVNDSKYDFCSKVTAVNGNVITVDILPFTGLVKDSGAAAAVIAGQFSDGYSIYIPDKPDAGIIDFGGGSFSEGGQSKASNICAHAEGLQTHAYGQYSHTEGRETKAGYGAHAEGYGTVAAGHRSHAEGTACRANGYAAHAEGSGTKADGRVSHTEGLYTEATSEGSHAEGRYTTASGLGAHSEGFSTEAAGNASHAEGGSTKATGDYSHAEGYGNITNGTNSHIEGRENVISTPKVVDGVHVEGYMNEVKEKNTQYSHLEGRFNKSLEGSYGSHIEGRYNEAYAVGVHIEGDHNQAFNNYEHACGKYNFSTKSSVASEATAFSIGNGTSSKRKNAVEVKQNGDVYIIGVGGYDGTNSGSSQTLQDILANL